MQDGVRATNQRDHQETRQRSQHRPTGWVGGDQPYRAVAVPRAQREVLVSGFWIWLPLLQAFVDESRQVTYSVLAAFARLGVAVASQATNWAGTEAVIPPRS